MSETPFDIVAAHRHFAVELNNRAWDLVEAEHRSDDETEQMIHAAHAALYHWSQVGSLLNRQRALCLLATACAVAERSSEARRYADECVAICRQEPDGQTAFDRATAHGCAAHAAALNGDSSEARRHYDQALEHVSGFDDANEALIFSQLYPEP